VRTTTYNLKVSRIQIGLMPTTRASHVHAACSHSIHAMSSTSLNNKHALPCLHARPSSTLQHYTTKEGIHLQQLTAEIFNDHVSGTTTILEGNRSAIAYSHNALVSEKTKCIDMTWHFPEDGLKPRTITLMCLPTY
jgi:hypothetical protein